MKKVLIIIIFVLSFFSGRGQTLDFKALVSLVDMPKDSIVKLLEKKGWNYLQNYNTIQTYTNKTSDVFELMNLCFDYDTFISYFIHESVYKKFMSTAKFNNPQGNYEISGYNCEVYRDKCGNTDFRYAFSVHPDYDGYYMVVVESIVEEPNYSFEECMEKINQCYKDGTQLTYDIKNSLATLKQKYETDSILDEYRYTEVCILRYMIYNNVGDTYNAYLTIRQAFDTFKRHDLDKNSDCIRRLKACLMSTLITLNNYLSARIEGEGLVKMCEEVNDYGFEYMQTQMQLAQCYVMFQDKDKAKKAINEAERIYNQMHGSIYDIKSDGQLLALNGFAQVFYYVGDTIKAEKCFKLIIEKSRQSYFELEAYKMASLYLAQIYFGREQFNDAIDLLSNMKSNDDDVNYSCYNILAACYCRTGENDKVAKCMNEFNRITLSKVTNIFSNYPSIEREDNWNKVSMITTNFNNSIAYKTGEPKILTTAYENNIFLEKIHIQFSILLAKCVEKSNDKDLIDLYNYYKQLKTNLIFNNQKGNYDNITAENIEEVLIKRVKNFREILRDEKTSFENIKHFLSKYEYAFDLAEVEEAGEKIIYAYTYNQYSSFPKLVYLCKYAELESLLSAKNSDIEFYNNLYLTEHSNKLYKFLFEPVLKYLPNARTIYYSPCGKLSQLNFELFTDDNGTPLNRKYKMIRVSSTANIPEIKSLDPKSFKTSALYGGIDYKNSIENSDVAVRGVDFRNLPNTGAEIKNVAKILTASNIKTDTICGENATEESFKKLSGNSPDILHIATHGFYLDEDSQKPFAQSVNTYSQKESAMALSGLALSGANNAWKGNFDLPNVEDGILTAYEISQLDLSNTKLVVLSACETARGRIFPVDGVFGLQRAFKQAGAGSILMSLWKVDDNAAATFMEYFYKFLLQSGDRHEALKMAQDEVKKQFPDPYYWAAWVMLD